MRVSETNDHALLIFRPKSPDGVRHLADIGECSITGISRSAKRFDEVEYPGVKAEVSGNAEAAIRTVRNLPMFQVEVTPKQDSTGSTVAVC